MRETINRDLRSIENEKSENLAIDENRKLQIQTETKSRSANRGRNGIRSLPHTVCRRGPNLGLHLSAVRGKEPRASMEGMSIRKTTLIKKLTTLIERWPIEAREQLLEAAWRIDGKLIADAFERGMGGDQSDRKPESRA